jgi:NADH-quinone oxidoreductase subunit M
MQESGFGLLSLTIFFPLLGVFLLMFMQKASPSIVKGVGVGITAVTFAISMFLWLGFDANNAGFQFIEKIAWIPTLNVSYHVGLDGMSVLLVMLTTFLTPLALIGTWNSITDRVREYTIMILLLEVGMAGVFAALDIFLFYVFWEAMLIPMYFIIGIWGGPDRIYAAVKFFLYTLFGSLLMLVAILALGYSATLQPGGEFTTDIMRLYEVAPQLPMDVQLWMFLAFALSFAIKVPLFPLHTWLPDAHVQAPTAGSVLLAGVLLKMGTFGFIRYCVPLFPDASLKAMPYIAALSVIGIIYGALVAMVQTDIKKLVAYSSVSHLGFVMLGIFSMTEEGMQGAILQMVNHGLSTGALFLLVGMVYDRTHTRMIADYGGLAKRMPVFAVAFLIMSLSSIGLPGLNGFVGEFMILLGAFTSDALDAKAYAVISAFGVILSAVYMLWMYQRVMLGPVREDDKYGGHFVFDIGRREIAVLIPIVLFVVWIGVYPGTFLVRSAQTARITVEKIMEARQGKAPGMAVSPGMTTDQRSGATH